MRKFKVIALLALLVSLFVSVDLGINCMGSLVTELQDGLSYNSLLQSLFGLLEGSLKTRADFFNVFKTSAWISFAILAVNIILYVTPLKNNK